MFMRLLRVRDLTDLSPLQAVTLLLILALMRGSVKTSLDALIHLLDPSKKEAVDEKLQSAAPQQVEGSTAPVVASDAAGAAKGKGREEALRSVVPYLKQLEDFRKHKELCSLFDEAYQGTLLIIRAVGTFGFFFSRDRR
jgi:hypothetical protein